MPKIAKVHVRALDPRTLFLSILVSVMSAMICMQIIVKIGVSANTSIIGALIAISISRIPFHRLAIFKSLDTQNLVQTMCSAAGFAAANCAILVLGMIYVMDERGYIPAMLIGGLIATLISVYMVYKIYDSALFPASAPWPPGIATAQALIAGDEGGNKAWRLVQGIGAGVIGSMIKIPAAWIGLPGAAKYGLPMAGIGIVFIANTWSMAALGLGLLIRGYLPVFTNINLSSTYIPHGMMIGAGLASLVQVIFVLARSHKHTTVNEGDGEYAITVSSGTVKKTIRNSMLLYFAGGLVLALISGIISDLGFAKLLLWLFWATIACIIAPFLSGVCAMRSGWFPAFAITTIFLAIGLFFGFPPIALALLTGYIACTGPCFADLGFDLKTGWILRGRNSDIAYELDGRKQQLIAGVIGVLVGFTVCGLTMNIFFEQGLIPPVSKVFAATISAGSNATIMKEMATWAILGLIIQFAGGTKRALGVLFATGLLINYPMYGIGVVFAVILKIIIGTERMEIREAGLIAGDGIYGFISAVITSLK